MTDGPGQTFLFADLAGFTALTEAHGDEEAAQLASDFFDRVRELLPEYGGEEIKTIGDAVLLRCEDATAAVELGLRLIEEIGTRPQSPVLRVGMHTGPAIERGGDWFGATVNLAARVSALAGGQEVLLTEATRDAAGKPAGIEFRHHGLQRFKHVNQRVEVYRAAREGEASEGLPIDPVCQMAVDPGQSAGMLSSRASSITSARLTASGRSRLRLRITSPRARSRTAYRNISRGNDPKERATNRD